MCCSSRCIIDRENSVDEKVRLSSILCALDSAIVDPIPSRYRSCQQNDRGDDGSLICVHIERHSSGYRLSVTFALNVMASFLRNLEVALVSHATLHSSDDIAMTLIMMRASYLNVRYQESPVLMHLRKESRYKAKRPRLNS